MKTFASLFTGFGGADNQRKGGYVYKCAVCDKTFKSYNPNPQYCSHVCKAQAQTSLIDFEQAAKLYESGLTQLEVGKHFGVTQKAIVNLFRRHGYESRRAIKRNQRGSANHMWKGKDATYSAFHDRVARARGKPESCEICGTRDPDKRYEWANLTGKYEDVHDYKRMCRSCHCKHDGLINNIRHMRGIESD